MSLIISEVDCRSSASEYGAFWVFSGWWIAFRMYVHKVTVDGGCVVPPLTLIHDLPTETPFDAK